jgi:hypothetical protein
MRMRWAWMATAATAALLASGSAAAKTYICRDAAGHTTISQFPCPVVQAAPPPPAMPPCSLTAEQRRVAERQEEQFILRFPDEASHRRAQLGDLQEVAVRIRLAAGRLDELKQQRKTLDEEIEFYKGKALTPDLSRRLDASEAKFAALVDVFRGEENDVRNVVTRYDCERTRFAILWHGGAAGSSACAASCKPT